MLPNTVYSDISDLPSSSSEDEVPDIIKLPKIVNNTQIVDDTTTYDNNNQIEGDIETTITEANNNIMNEGVSPEVLPLTLATDAHINELKELINTQMNLIETQNGKIDNLTLAVTNISKQIKKLRKMKKPISTIMSFSQLDGLFRWKHLTMSKNSKKL